jgi:hypothetical protein
VNTVGNILLCVHFLGLCVLFCTLIASNTRATRTRQLILNRAIVAGSLTYTIIRFRTRIGILHFGNYFRVSILEEFHICLLGLLACKIQRFSQNAAAKLLVYKFHAWMLRICIYYKIYIMAHAYCIIKIY